MSHPGGRMERRFGPLYIYCHIFFLNYTIDASLVFLIRFGDADGFLYLLSKFQPPFFGNFGQSYQLTGV